MERKRDNKTHKHTLGSKQSKDKIIKVRPHQLLSFLTINSIVAGSWDDNNKNNNNNNNKCLAENGQKSLNGKSIFESVTNKTKQNIVVTVLFLE